MRAVRNIDTFEISTGINLDGNSRNIADRETGCRFVQRIKAAAYHSVDGRLLGRHRLYRERENKANQNDLSKGRFPHTSTPHACHWATQLSIPGDEKHFASEKEQESGG
jgi:hypothetical protein